MLTGNHLSTLPDVTTRQNSGPTAETSSRREADSTAFILREHGGMTVRMLQGETIRPGGSPAIATE
jgi:hypothetical protein